MDVAPSYETVAKGPEFRSHPSIKPDEKPGMGTQSPTLSDSYMLPPWRLLLTKVPSRHAQPPPHEQLCAQEHRTLSPQVTWPFGRIGNQNFLNPDLSQASDQQVSQRLTMSDYAYQWGKN